jgi:hypothetical protein
LRERKIFRFFRFRFSAFEAEIFRPKLRAHTVAEKPRRAALERNGVSSSSYFGPFSSARARFLVFGNARDEAEKTGANFPLSAFRFFPLFRVGKLTLFPVRKTEPERRWDSASPSRLPALPSAGRKSKGGQSEPGPVVGERRP